jgi:hypothetical protein
MVHGGALAASVLAAAMLATFVPAAFDRSENPDLKGQWRRGPV